MIHLWRDKRSGITTTSYAVMASLIALVAGVGLAVLGTTTSEVYQSATDQVEKNSSGGGHPRKRDPQLERNEERAMVRALRKAFRKADPVKNIPKKVNPLDMLDVASSSLIHLGQWSLTENKLYFSLGGWTYYRGQIAHERFDGEKRQFDYYAGYHVGRKPVLYTSPDRRTWSQEELQKYFKGQ